MDLADQHGIQDGPLSLKADQSEYRFPMPVGPITQDGKWLNINRWGYWNLLYKPYCVQHGHFDSFNVIILLGAQGFVAMFAVAISRFILR